MLKTSSKRAMEGEDEDGVAGIVTINQTVETSSNGGMTLSMLVVTTTTRMGETTGRMVHLRGTAVAMEETEVVVPDMVGTDEAAETLSSRISNTSKVPTTALPHKTAMAVEEEQEATRMVPRLVADHPVVVIVVGTEEGQGVVVEVEALDMVALRLAAGVTLTMAVPLRTHTVHMEKVDMVAMVAGVHQVTVLLQQAMAVMGATALLLLPSHNNTGPIRTTHMETIADVVGAGNLPCVL
jgi:hypothetical protein